MSDLPSSKQCAWALGPSAALRASQTILEALTVHLPTALSLHKRGVTAAHVATYLEKARTEQSNCAAFSVACAYLEGARMELEELELVPA